MSEAKNADNISAVTVNASVLCDIIGVSDRRIRGLAAEGILVKASRGRYKLIESLKNYILTLRISNKDNLVPSSQDLDLDTEKAKHEVIKIQMSELKLRLMEGSVHKSEDVRAVMSDMLVAFRSRLMNHPAKSAPVLANMYDPGQIQNYLEKEMMDALLELRDYNPKEFYNDDYIDTEGGGKDGDAKGRRQNDIPV